MSIWTELLFLHGHVATPTALALIAPAAVRGAADPTARPPQAAATTAEPYRHPLRAVGQLR